MTIPINTDGISSTSELIGTVFEEVSHLLDSTAGRTKKTEETRLAGEEGLESLGRPVNDYFKEQYKEDDTPITLKDSGRDLTNADLGTKVGEDFIFKRFVQLEYSKYYKYAEVTLKSLGNNTDKLLELYGVTENETLTVVRMDKIRGVGAGILESTLVSFATGGADKWVKIGIGTVYFLSDNKGIIEDTVKLSSEVKKENALKYVTYVEEERKGIAERTYYGEINDLSGLYHNYVNGKMPTLKEIREYNRTKRTNYSLDQIKTRLWKVSQYNKTGNPDYYVVPRRINYYQK